MPKIYAFLSVGRRAGKKTVATNLAVAAMDVGQKVVIADPALIHARIGTEPRILNQFEPELDHTQLIVKSDHGLKLLPRTWRRQLSIAGPAGAEVWKRRARDVLQEFDMVFVDLEEELGHGNPLLEMGDWNIVLVLRGSKASVLDGFSSVQRHARKFRDIPFHFVVNDVPKGQDPQEIFEDLSSAATVFLHIDMRMAGAIPNDPNLMHTALTGGVVIRHYPDSPASRGFRDLVGNLQG